MTGLSIGCVTSVKWIGLFVMALVGAHTADGLWEKFGDLRMPLVSPIHLFPFYHSIETFFFPFFTLGTHFFHFYHDHKTEDVSQALGCPNNV
jgi:dolichyl-phosphate-mannose--protein O-mannosyl transferase